MYGTLWLLTQREARKTKRLRLFTEFVSRRLAAYAPLLAGLSISPTDARQAAGDARRYESAGKKKPVLAAPAFHCRSQRLLENADGRRGGERRREPIAHNVSGDGDTDVSSRQRLQGAPVERRRDLGTVVRLIDGHRRNAL